MIVPRITVLNWLKDIARETKELNALKTKTILVVPKH